MSPAELTALIEIALPSLIAMVAIGSAGKVIATWIRYRGGAAPKELRAISEQLNQLQQAVDTIAIEVERIEESQRFNARLLSEGRSSLPGSERRPCRQGQADGQPSVIALRQPPATMIALLKLLQSLVKTLHSDGTPHQIALGVALGAALGLTPIANVHNVVVVVLLIMLNVSFAAGLLAWALFTPIGFLLDPAFDRIGRALLLESASLQPLWTSLDHTPFVPFTNFGNTVVLGSVIGWLILSAPIYLATRLAVVRYRTVYATRVRQWRIVQAVTASKAYNVWQWFHA